jgi:hypothetical protein
MSKTATQSKSTPPAVEVNYKSTGVNLPSDIWELLHRVSFERAKSQGGRPSVSALLVDLVQKHRKELEKELASASR